MKHPVSTRLLWRVLWLLALLTPLACYTGGDYARGSAGSPGSEAKGDIASQQDDSAGDTEATTESSDAGNGTDGDASTNTSTSDDGASTGEPAGTTSDGGEPVAFATTVWPMFKNRCSCHVGFPAGGLALEQGTAHVSVVGARAVGAEMDYVVPGDLANSYLWRKLLGEQAQVGGGGVQMPQAGVPLIDEELALVEQWILDGAIP